MDPKNSFSAFINHLTLKTNDLVQIHSALGTFLLWIYSYCVLNLIDCVELSEACSTVRLSRCNKVDQKLAIFGKKMALNCITLLPQRQIETDTQWKNQPARWHLSSRRASVPKLPRNLLRIPTVWARNKPCFGGSPPLYFLL